MPPRRSSLSSPPPRSDAMCDHIASSLSVPSPLCLQLEVGASIYKEGDDSSPDSDVLVLKVRSINALVNL